MTKVSKRQQQEQQNVQERFTYNSINDFRTTITLLNEKKKKKKKKDNSTNTTSTNDTNVVVLGIFLVDGSWNCNRTVLQKNTTTTTTTAESTRSTVTSYKDASELLIRHLFDYVTIGIDVQYCHTVYDVIYIDQSDDDYDCFLRDNGYNYCNDDSTQQQQQQHNSANSTLPQLVIAYQNCSTMVQSIIEVVPIPNQSLDIINAIVHVHTIIDKTATFTTNTNTSLTSSSYYYDYDYCHRSNPKRYWNTIVHPLETLIDTITFSYNIPIQVTTTNMNYTSAVRLFIAGDRSSVGKSSICLGLIGSILKNQQQHKQQQNQHNNNDMDLILNDTTYLPCDIAYIKPATQSESIQLIQHYCEINNIDCRPIGPIVYYRGFTRAYLANDTPTTIELLYYCQRCVDRISYGKKLVLIDGVGYPSVGSICGTDNPTVAYVCGYPNIQSLSSLTSSLTSPTSVDSMIQQRIPPPVLLVGGVGVGGAIDAFNLNASYFQQHRNNVPVIGVVFNKLPTDPTNFYSLQNCQEQITLYFERQQYQQQQYDQNTIQRKPYGFIPACPWLSDSKVALQRLDEFFDIFTQHVKVQDIVNVVKSYALEACSNVRSQSVTVSTAAAIAHHDEDNDMQIDLNDQQQDNKNKGRYHDDDEHFRVGKQQKLNLDTISNHPSTLASVSGTKTTIQLQHPTPSSSLLRQRRSRKDIESLAIASGAAPSA